MVEEGPDRHLKAFLEYEEVQPTFGLQATENSPDEQSLQALISKHQFFPSNMETVLDRSPNFQPESTPNKAALSPFRSRASLQSIKPNKSNKKERSNSRSTLRDETISSALKRSDAERMGSISSLVSLAVQEEKKIPKFRRRVRKH